jgi:hypothetical protein
MTKFDSRLWHHILPAFLTTSSGLHLHFSLPLFAAPLKNKPFQATMSDRPGDWLGGYGPSNSPLIEKHHGGTGPTSPKKKLMSSWTLGKESLNAIPNFEKSSTSGVAENKAIETDKEDEETIAVDDGGEEEEEVVVEELEEDISERVIEYSESEASEDSNDDLEEEIELLASAIKPSVHRGKSFDSDDDCFEALPPPIEIPNALRPVHLRTPEVTNKTFLADSLQSSDEETSEEESDLDESKHETHASTLRPSVGGEQPPARSSELYLKHSDALEKNESKQKHKMSQNEASVTTPASIETSLRLTTLRGRSFEGPDPPRTNSPRRGYRPTPTCAVEGHDSGKRQFTTSIRPATERGHSFDDSNKEISPTNPRRGTRPALRQTTQDIAGSEVAENCNRDEGQMVAEQLEPVQASDAYIRENKVHQAKNIPPQTATNHVKRNASGNAEISWEKPSWTKSTLRATRKGEQLKSEGNLAAPITKVREL